MKPIKSSEILLKYMDLQNPRPGEGDVFVDESGAYWYYTDGSYHKISNGSPFGNEIPGQLIIIDGKLYVITNDGQLVLCDVSNEYKTGGA